MSVDVATKAAGAEPDNRRGRACDEGDEHCQSDKPERHVTQYSLCLPNYGSSGNCQRESTLSSGWLELRSGLSHWALPKNELTPPAHAPPDLSTMGSHTWKGVGVGDGVMVAVGVGGGSKGRLRTGWARSSATAIARLSVWYPEAVASRVMVVHWFRYSAGRSMLYDPSASLRVWKLRGMHRITETVAPETP